LAGIAWGLLSNFLTSAITLAIALPVAARSGIGGGGGPQFPPPRAFGGDEFTDDEIFNPDDIAGEFAGETDADDLTTFTPTVPCRNS
jgi:hypothetical protein